MSRGVFHGEEGLVSYGVGELGGRGVALGGAQLGERVVHELFEHIFDSRHVLAQLTWSGLKLERVRVRVEVKVSVSGQGWG